MALARCEDHEWPAGRTAAYVARVRPVGHPESSTICGNPDCKKPGLIYSNNDEASAVAGGAQIVGFATNTVRVRVDPSTLKYWRLDKAGAQEHRGLPV